MGLSNGHQNPRPVSIVKKKIHKYPHHFNAIKHVYRVNYRHLIPAPVDRTFASDWLYYPPWITCQQNKLSSSMTHVACQSKLRLVVRSSLHPCPENLVAKGRAVVYYAWAALTHIVQELNVGTIVSSISVRAIVFE